MLQWATAYRAAALRRRLSFLRLLPRLRLPLNLRPHKTLRRRQTTTT